MPYHSYDELIRLFMDLERRHPDVVSHEEIGRSVRGIPTYLFRIGQWWKPSVFIEGSIHGNEHPGAEMLLLYARWLVERAEPVASEILDSVYTLIVPVVNADGFDVYRRVNANCVDLNRNFPKGWGGHGSSPGTCCSICRGNSAADQPETKAMINAVERYRPVWALNIHTGIEVLAYPWSCWRDEPKDKVYYTSVCRKYVELAESRRVKPYEWGQISWRYPPVDLAVPVRIPVYPFVIYVCCGTTVDTWYDRGVFSMVLEATSPFNPPYETVESIYFPRFLPVAITLSRELFAVIPPWWWLVSTAIGATPIIGVSAIVTSEEARKMGLVKV